MSLGPFPLPRECFPQCFHPVVNDILEKLEEDTSTFYFHAASPTIATGLVSALEGQPRVAMLDFTRDVQSSGRLTPKALRSLQEKAGDGEAPWWVVVHGLEAARAPDQVVNGANMLNILLEHGGEKVAVFEGVALKHSRALLVGEGLTYAALAEQWHGRAREAERSATKGQKKLNPTSVLERIDHKHLPSVGPGRCTLPDWREALHSRGCAEARASPTLPQSPPSARQGHSSSGSGNDDAARRGGSFQSLLTFLPVAIVALFFTVLLLKVRGAPPLKFGPHPAATAPKPKGKSPPGVAKQTATNLANKRSHSRSK